MVELVRRSHIPLLVLAFHPDLGESMRIRSHERKGLANMSHIASSMHISDLHQRPDRPF